MTIARLGKEKTLAVKIGNPCRETFILLKLVIIFMKWNRKNDQRSIKKKKKEVAIFTFLRKWILIFFFSICLWYMFGFALKRCFHIWWHEQWKRAENTCSRCVARVKKNCQENREKCFLFITFYCLKEKWKCYISNNSFHILEACFSFNFQGVTPIMVLNMLWKCHSLTI